MHTLIDARNMASFLGLVAIVFLAASVRADSGAMDWAGAYGGLAAGAKAADAKWTTTQLADPPSLFVGFSAPDGSSPDTFRPLGLRLGGYAGYNWRLGNWVYGLELDAAWANDTDRHAGVPGCKVSCFPGVPGPGNDSSAVRIMWDASVRGRVGYLVTPTLLLYGTGGIAWQSIDVSATCESTLADPLCLVFPPLGAKTQTDRAVLTGWTVGAGVERMLTDRWLIRAEYRYAHFGTVSGVLFAGQPASDPGADAVHYDVTVRTHIATIGLIYKF
jgi:outer membrane immunogenic protein